VRAAEAAERADSLATGAAILGQAHTAERVAVVVSLKTSPANVSVGACAGGVEWRVHLTSASIAAL
jgi:hypothetical protein